MKIFSFLISALLLSVLGLGLSGCSGGSSGNGNSNGTRADVNFLNTSSTAANVTPISLRGGVSQVTANSTGVHTGYVEQFDEFHILLLAKNGSLSRVLSFELFTDNPTEPEVGDTLEAEVDVDIDYTERDGITVNRWTATSGSIKVTGVTNGGFTVSGDGLSFERSGSPGDILSVEGSFVVGRNGVMDEPDENFHSHETGFETSMFDARRAAGAKAPDHTAPKPTSGNCRFQSGLSAHRGTRRVSNATSPFRLRTQLHLNPRGFVRRRRGLAFWPTL